tara:strand:- start:164 stop:421 length:258 start_codon:yes stop_codon:yes gene_type:complete
MKQLNFNNQKSVLTEEDKEEIFDILVKGTRIKTRELLAERLNKHIDLIPEYGIFNRLIKESYGWSYCAGQSYSDEIRCMREIILN